MKVIAELPLEQSLKISLYRGDGKRTIKVGQRRFNVSNLRTFAVHGCKCVRCGREGNRLVAWQDKGGGLHVDLFADNNGGLILMNRDHIIPKSKKGSNSDWNYQTMCVKCNCKKGNNESREDRALALFRSHWKKIHMALHDSYWKTMPKFLRNKKLDNHFVTFRELHMHKVSYFLAKLTHVFA